MTDGYEIKVMTSEDVETAVGWARAEGWNPGLGDAGCFLTVDREGFIGGYRDGELIASISVVNYDDSFSFLGLYIVRADVRGLGYGLALWRKAIAHAGDRLIGLDGVPAQIANYEKSGFALAYRNIRYGGAIDAATPSLRKNQQILPAGELPLSALSAYDRVCFPAARDHFLRAWTTTDGHRALGLVTSGALTGYGVIRPCHLGYKVGPLFANEPDGANTLLVALAADTGAAPVFLDMPELHPAAVALAESLSMTPVFETARMYTGPAPEVSLERVFGVSTFELG